MVITRSKGNERDKKSCTDANLAAKKPNSKDSNSNKNSSVSSSNTITPYPLRRSTRETPTKKKTQVSGTTPSSSTKRKNPTSNSTKSVSGGSGSSAKTPKKRSKGKEKALVEEENSKTGKRDLSSSSPLNENEKEEGSSAKRRRLHMHAKRSKELFMPRSKISKHSPTVEKAEAVEAPVDTDLIVDNPEANSTMKVSENNADPLKNELARIKHQENILARHDEARRLQIKMLMEEEMEVVKRKYEEMVREHENTVQHQKQQLEDVYKKVLLNQSLAEEFHTKFIDRRNVPSASPSASASSHLRSHMTGHRPQLLPQHRVPQQIQRAPAPAAAVSRQGSVSVNANGSLKPPSVASLNIPSTSSPLRPSTASPNPNRATFSPVSLPPRPGPPLRTAPAPQLARARPHMSALPPTSTPMQQLQPLLARSQEAPPAQTQNFLREGTAAVSQTQTQNQNQPV